MSLFIGTLAFGRHGESYEAMVRVGVIAGSFLSGLLGYFILRFSQQKHADAIWHENKSGTISSYPFSCALRAGASYNYLL